ncbi:MAG: protein kinase [Planctomycetota bacterium]|nr:protein kinase [Planctomycetota bacterium]
MDIDQQQYQLILTQGHIPKDRLDKAFSHPNRRIYNDFVEFLLHSLMLRADIALDIRQQASRPSQKLPLPGQSANSAMMTVADLERAYHHALLTHPLFSPHARDQFNVIEKLGEGGMGIVHRIEDKNLGRTAALKVLGEIDASERMVKRFIREARITASLSHPNIPPIYELGMNSSGEYYMLMKVIEGQSLKEALTEVHSSGQSNPKEVRRLLEALVKVCEAVAYAHSQEVIHRDLKPENIMIGEFGEVMVLDWGLARDFSDKTVVERVGGHPEKLLELKEAAQKEGLTGKGDLLGTVGYMAPEQIDGEANKQSDVFALGAILTEILTGKKAIAGDSAISKVSATIQGRISGPHALDEAAPMELNAVAVKSLRMSLEQRTGTVVSFATDLKAYLSGAEVKAYRYSLFERVQRWISRHPTLVSGSFLSILFIVSVLFFQSNIQSSERQQTKLERKRAVTLLEKKKVDTARQMFDEGETAANKKIFTKESGELVQKALEIGGRSESNLLRAARIYQKGQAKAQSRSLYLECVKTFPPAYKALFQLHILETGWKNPVRTSSHLRELTKLVDQGPKGNVYLLMARLIGAFQKKKWDEVVELCKRIENDKDDNFPIHNIHALAHVELGQFDLAVVEFLKHAKLFPGGCEALVNIAKVKKRLGEFQSAISYCDKAIAIDSSHLEAFMIRGQSNESLKRIDLAAIDFKKAHYLAPNDTEINLAVGRCLTSLKKFQEAWDYYNLIVGVNREDPKSYIYRGLYSERAGNNYSAKLDYQRAIGKDPRCADAYYRLGDLLDRQSLFQKALDVHTKGIALSPNKSRFYFARGQVYFHLKDWKRAIADYDKAASLNEKNPLLFLNRGKALETLKCMKDAALNYESFLQRMPNWVNAKELREFIKANLNRKPKD